MASGAPGSVILRPLANAFAISDYAWSPDGSELLVLEVAGPSGGTSAVILSRDGQKLDEFAASAAAWVDQGHVVFLTASDGGRVDAGIRNLGDHAVASLGGGYVDASPILVSPAGDITLQRGSSGPAADFDLWHAGTLRPAIPGIPVAWSHDGSLLAVIHPRTSTGGTGNAGSAWMDVMRVDGGQTVAAFPNEYIGLGTTVSFDPTGHVVAACGGATDGPCRPQLMNVVTGTTTVVGQPPTDDLGWLADGRLYWSDGSRIQFWTASGGVVDPRLPPGSSVSTTSSADVLIVVGDSEAADVIDHGVATEVALPGVATGPVVWSGTDGAVAVRLPDGTEQLLRLNLR